MRDNLEGRSKESVIKKTSRIVFGGKEFVGRKESKSEYWEELENSNKTKEYLSSEIANQAMKDCGYGPGDYVEYEIKIKPKNNW